MVNVIEMWDMITTKKRRMICIDDLAILMNNNESTSSELNRAFHKVYDFFLEQEFGSKGYNWSISVLHKASKDIRVDYKINAFLELVKKDSIGPLFEKLDSLLENESLMASFVFAQICKDINRLDSSISPYKIKEYGNKLEEYSDNELIRYIPYKKNGMYRLKQKKPLNVL